MGSEDVYKRQLRRNAIVCKTLVGNSEAQTTTNNQWYVHVYLDMRKALQEKTEYIKWSYVTEATIVSM